MPSLAMCVIGINVHIKKVLKKTTRPGLGKP